MSAYLGEIWKCRFFWLSLVKMDLRARYRGSTLGIGWSLLHPIAMTTILCVVFHVWMNADLRFYAPFVFTGMTFWGFFSSVVLQGCHCFFQGEAYIRQHPAPMAIYPLRTVLGSAFHFGVGLLLAIVLAFCVRPAVDTPVRTQMLGILSLLPTFVILLFFGWSVSVVFGLLNVRFRDTRHLAEVGLQGLFYLTPIMMDFSGAMRGRRLFLVLQCNPLVSFLDLLRDPILKGHPPSLATYGLASIVTVVLGGAAMVALKIDERRLIFHL
jgi:lipopolysaccharide transport system permease protein